MPSSKQIKFTGKSGMSEAVMGELSTLNPLGGILYFADVDPQYLNASTFATPITQQDGTRIEACNIIANTLINRFIRVKRIEVCGDFTAIASSPDNIFSSPVLSAQIFNAGLCMVNDLDSLTLIPDYSSPNVYVGTKDVPISRFYADCDFLMSTFTSFIFQARNTTIDTTNKTTIRFYYDEEHPMAVYHEHLLKNKCIQY